MSAFTPAVDAALTGPSPTIFGAVEIVLPAHTIRLLDGSGVVSFGGKTFSGRDATYGVIEAIEELADGTGDEAPAVLLTLAPASDAAAADLASPAMQGAPVSIWLGVVEPSTGGVIDSPLLVFSGMLDVPTLRAGKNSRLLDLEISSSFEDFFLSDDGCRLSDRFHQNIWSGEKGLSFATGITQQIYWGANAPTGVTYGQSGGAGSFGNTGGGSGTWEK